MALLWQTNSMNGFHFRVYDDRVHWSQDGFIRKELNADFVLMKDIVHVRAESPLVGQQTLTIHCHNRPPLQFYFTAPLNEHARSAIEHALARYHSHPGSS